MKAVGLSTLLSIGTELATSEEDRLIRAIHDGAQDTINQAGQPVADPVKLIVPMLERFIATDRGFATAKRSLAQSRCE